MKNNKHLSLAEREKITVLQGQELSVRKIAKELGRSPSTMSRELNRPNALYYREIYIGSQTHLRVEKAWQAKHKRPNLFLNQRNVSYFIECELKKAYTPEIICHELKEKFGETVSHETLYVYIYSSPNGLSRYLLRRPYGRKHRRIERPKRQGTGKNIPNRIDISLRPIEATNRTEFGHFEADSIESCKKRGEQLPCLTVRVERVSRYTIIRKTASKTSQATTKSIVTALKPLSTNIISITYDNGCEFSQHEKINKKLNTTSYFARPYCSNDKGTVENINGLIRMFLPKGTDFDNISDEQIKRIENWVNNRSMKVLGWKSSNEIFKKVAL